MKENRFRLLVALGAFPMALAACGSSTAGKGPGDGMTTVPPGGTAGSTGTGGGAMVPPDGGLLPDGPCVQGVPVTTQIPRILNRQYDNVLRDLLGVTALDGGPVSASLVGDFTGA